MNTPSPDSSQQGDTLIRCHNLTLGYDRHPAVHHLETRICAGTMLALVGPNGAGKSTLLKALTGELKPMQGQIDLHLPSSRIAYLPQMSEMDASFPVSVFDMVAMGLWSRIGVFGGVSRTDRERIQHALAQVGLTGYERRPVGALSGGQLQRARFARLMLQDCSLLLLDEPFNAIDSRTTDDLLHLMQHWRAEGRTLIAVLHDLERVRQHFPESLLIARELIAQGRTADVLSPENLARARQLADAFDEKAPVCHRQTEGQTL